MDSPFDVWRVAYRGRLEEEGPVSAATFRSAARFFLDPRLVPLVAEDAASIIGAGGSPSVARTRPASTSGESTRDDRNQGPSSSTDPAQYPATLVRELALELVPAPRGDSFSLSCHLGLPLAAVRPLPWTPTSVIALLQALIGHLEQTGPHGWLTPAALFSAPGVPAVEIFPALNARLLARLLGARAPKPNPLLEVAPSLLGYLGPTLLESDYDPARADRHALGVLAFWLRTARAPYADQGYLALAGSVRRAEPNTLDEWRADLGEECARFVEAALRDESTSLAGLSALLPLAETAVGGERASALTQYAQSEQQPAGDRQATPENDRRPRELNPPLDEEALVARFSAEAGAFSRAGRLDDKASEALARAFEMQLASLRSERKPTVSFARRIWMISALILALAVTLAMVVWPSPFFRCGRVRHPFDPQTRKTRTLTPDEIEIIRRRDEERRREQERRRDERRHHDATR